MLISFHQAFGTCSRKTITSYCLFSVSYLGKATASGVIKHISLFFSCSVYVSLVSYFHFSFSHLFFPSLLVSSLTCSVVYVLLFWLLFYLNNLGKMWFMHYTDAVFLFCSCQCLCAQLKIRSVAQNVLQVFLIITCYLFIVFIYVLFLYLEVYHAITVDGYVCFWACTQNCLVCQYAAGYWYWMWHIGFI